MVPSKQVLPDLIGRIYDAAADPSLWEPFLEQVSKISRGTSAALVMHHLGHKMHTISASWNIDPKASLLYQQYYGSIDVWAMRAHGKPAGCVCSSESLCSPQELRGTEFFNDFLAWNNVAHGTFGLVEKNGSHLASLSIYRDSSSKEFEVAALDTLNFLIPHMQRAFKLHFQFSELKARAERTETALDMLSTGVIFLGDKGEIVLMNRSADELLRRKDGLRLEHGKLITSLCSESAVLQSMIAAAAQTGSGKGLSAGGTMLITGAGTE